MKKLSWLIAILAITVLFFRCQKELHFTGGPDTGIPVTPDPIKASVQGNVTDENNQPAAGVVVTAGASTTITDANGYFRFTDASLDKNTSLVTVTKDGYFTGYRVFAATSGCNQVAIKLLKKDLAGTVAASSGGEVALASGAKVKLASGGVVTASSNGAYSGDVKVYASYIDPRSPDISKTIPGSLTGNDKDGKRVTLSSYGMIAVELSSASGDKLQIKSGSVATLTIPIPSAGDVSAPATIPLWYVDETTGIWQEEGTATKQGNTYVGDVKHFSFWNCDYPSDAVNLSLTLQTPSGSPLIYSQVRISAVSTSDTGSSYLSSRYDYTDSLGQVNGLVPANEELTLEVLGNCGSVVYSQTLQPLAGNKNLGVIKITDNTASLFTVTGTLQTCNNTAVSNGYAIIDFDGTRRYISANTNGIFTTTYVVCPSSITTFFVSGVDASSNTQSVQATVNATLPLTDVGTITVCGNSTTADEYINYTIDGVAYSISNTNPGDSLSGFYDANNSQVQLSGFASSSSKYLKFYAFGLADTAGIYSLRGLYVRSADSVNLSDPNPRVTFTQSPLASGGYYQGSFDNLTYWDSIPSAQHTISATFKIKKN